MSKGLDDALRHIDEAQFGYTRALERYLCECISLLAQHDIAPPDPSDERVKAVLQEKFINAIKGN